MTTEEKNSDVLTVQETKQTADATETGNDHGVDMLMDVNMNVTVELGRAKIKVKNLMELTSGSVIELDKLAGEPVDILVNGTLMAHAEVVVVDDNFAVRITKMLNRADRQQKHC